MITQTLKLNLIPGQVLPRVNVSQYDYGSRTLEFKLFNGNQSFTLTSSMTAKISGTKADMHGFEYDATVDTTNQKIVADLTQQMTAAAGDVTCELIIKKSGERLGTCNFVISVEKAALGDDAIISDTELPEIIAEATAQMKAAATSAQSAATSASRASTSASNAASSATSAANSATSASNSASSAATSAQEAEDSAKRAATSASRASTSASNAASSATSAATSASRASTSASNAASSATSAASSATSAGNSATSAANSAASAEESADRAQSYSVNTPYIGANGNWWVWNTTQEAYVDTGVDASITVDIADITMLAPDATPYVTNTGTNTDPIFHLFLPRYKTAYEFAVDGGYDRTEAEFDEELKDFKDLSDSAVSAASRAAISEANAQASKERAVLAETNSSTSETNANQSALDAEAWAVGQRNGVDVSQLDKTFENNSKYYASLSQDIKDYVAGALQEMAAYYKMILATIGTSIRFVTESGDSLVTEDGNNIIVDY